MYVHNRICKEQEQSKNFHKSYILIFFQFSTNDTGQQTIVILVQTLEIPQEIILAS